MPKRPSLGKWLLGFLIKDVRVFSADKQAVVMSFVVPVLIASILGWLDSSASSDKAAQAITIDWVDLDQSAVSKAVYDKLVAGGTVKPIALSEAEARRQVRTGLVPTAIIVPHGFGAMAPAALTGGAKPSVEFLTDPSKQLESQVALGAMMQEASSAVAKQAFGAFAGDASAPFVAHTTHGTAEKVNWGSAAHDYAGFGLQGLLFFAMEAAVGLARERRLGIWRRLQASPVPSNVILLARGVSSTVLALGIILTIFLFGALLFGIRILGSGIGFGAIAVATAVMAATFGLFVSTIGKTETQSRGISILLILIMLAIGGAWFPMARMPAVVQTISNWLPVRWAVEGFDAMTWRGLGLHEALPAVAALAGFALLFGFLAALRFRAAASHD